MAIKIAINGAGRIGRAVAKLALTSDDFQLTHINDLATPTELLYLLKFDSIQQGLEELTLKENRIFFRDKSFLVTNYKDNRDLRCDCDILVDATGVYNTTQDNLHHLKNGVKKVVLTSTPSDETKVAAYKINEEALKEKVVSFGSCTTTPLAFILDILKDKFSIESGTVTSIHSYNADQNLLDSKHHKSLRLARSSPNNIIPIDTGAARNLPRVMDLDFSIEGRGIRVPTPDVSLLDIVLKLKSATTSNEIKDLLKKRVASEYQDILSVTQEELVSSDFIGSSYAGVVDLGSTYVLNNLVKIVVWHDNEYGYANYLLNLIRKVEKIGAY